ncbi:MAG TPA: biosynthetic peptidoglycan transglycosylase, partial [Aestuariivirga sp.]
MAKLPTNNWFYRLIWTADSVVSSAVYETWAAFRGWVSGYSSWLYRWFHIAGLKRLLFDAMSEGITLLVGVIFVLLAYALPDFDSSGDVWNRGRQYAITFTDADGKVLGKRGISQNDSIPINEFPPILIKAVLATEDARFYDHMGVDVVGTLRAIVHNSRGGSRQGGSSITQQVVKNLLLTPEK